VAISHPGIPGQSSRVGGFGQRCGSMKDETRGGGRLYPLGEEQRKLINVNIDPHTLAVY